MLYIHFILIKFRLDLYLQGQDQGFGLTSEMQSQIAGKMFELGTSKAKEAFSLYGRIDILRPYFDVEPSQVQKRLVSALIPEKLTGTTPIVVRFGMFYCYITTDILDLPTRHLIKKIENSVTKCDIPSFLRVE